MKNKKIVITVREPKERKDFGKVKPFTRIEPDKTKTEYRNRKHKKPIEPEL
ncbi:MAG: hypothetical protein FWD89_02255 [Firmicutes bacterium]|nr:hypothetical protein [Bacillota bacterium]MCL2771113.1 hypothetical protein [Bacillota bacterium]